MALLTKMSQSAVVTKQVCLQQPFELFETVESHSIISLATSSAGVLAY